MVQKVVKGLRFKCGIEERDRQQTKKDLGNDTEGGGTIIRLKLECYLILCVYVSVCFSKLLSNQVNEI